MYRQSLKLVLVGDHQWPRVAPWRGSTSRSEQTTLRQDVQEIVRAASTGRVEHLFLLENGAVAGAVDGGADLPEHSRRRNASPRRRRVQTLPETQHAFRGPYLR